MAPLQLMLIYLIGGSAFACFVLVWALKNRQFQEQERARFLPLKDLSEAELANPPRRRVPPSVALIFVVLAVGLGAIVYTLVRVSAGA